MSALLPRRLAAEWLRQLATRVERGLCDEAIGRVERGLCDEAIGRVEGPDSSGRVRVNVHVRGYVSGSERELGEVRR